MKTHQNGEADGLLIEAGAMLRHAADPQSRGKAFALALRAVAEGAVGGHALLARMYHVGLGTRANLAKATKHYALAAIHGDAPSDRAWAWLMALEGFLWHRGDAFNRF